MHLPKVLKTQLLRPSKSLIPRFLWAVSSGSSNILIYTQAQEWRSARSSYTKVFDRTTKTTALQIKRKYCAGFSILNRIYRCMSTVTNRWKLLSSQCHWSSLQEAAQEICNTFKFRITFGVTTSCDITKVHLDTAEKDVSTVSA